MDHARLSASGAHRWMRCPGSIVACEAMPEKQPNVYMLEGVLAHDLADHVLEKNLDVVKFTNRNYKGRVIKKGMVEAVKIYVDYVRQLLDAGNHTRLYTEERVEFSDYVPDGFGTMDAAVFEQDTGLCHIFDLKYGKGVAVSATGNEQGMLYALGFYQRLNYIENFKRFTIHIVQPRIRNSLHSNCLVTTPELLEFGERATKAAALALGDNPKRVAGAKQCRFCEAKSNCQEYSDFKNYALVDDFDNLI